MHSCAPWLEPWAPWYMFSMHPSAHKKTLVRPLVYYVHPVLCYFGVVYINIACHHHDVTWNIDHKEWRQVWNLKKHNHIRDPDNISIEMIKWLISLQTWLDLEGVMSSGMGIYTSSYKSPYMNNSVAIMLQTLLSKKAEKCGWYGRNWSYCHCGDLKILLLTFLLTLKLPRLMRLWRLSNHFKVDLGASNTIIFSFLIWSKQL